MGGWDPGYTLPFAGPPLPASKKNILIYDHPFQGGVALFLQREAAFGEANERVFTPPDPAQVAGNIRPAGKAKENRKQKE